MEWQPIETYDKLKKKPKFAIFFVEEAIGDRSYTWQDAMIITTRNCGSRTIKLWMPIEAPKQDESRDAMAKSIARQIEGR